MPASLLFKTSSPILTAQIVQQLQTHRSSACPATSSMTADGFFVSVEVASDQQEHDVRHTVALIDDASIEICAAWPT